MTTLHPNLQAADLALEIADDFARTLIETRALTVGVVRGPEGDTPLYDVTQLDPFEAGPDELRESALEDLRRATKYVQLRGLAVRPVGNENLLTFGRAA